MATLTETAHVSRLFIKIGGILLLTLMIGRFAATVIGRYWRATHPPAPPPPTMAFGALPAMVFPQRPALNLTYILQTPTGTLPVFDNRIEVYLMPEKRPRFLADEQSIKDATALGFTQEHEIRSETIFRFSKSNPLPAQLDMNIYTGKFSLNVDWTQDPNFLTVRKLPADDEAINEAKAFLKRADLIPKDLAEGETHITYLKAGGGSYRQTVSLSEADFIRADVFRAAINDTYEAVTPDPNQGIARLILSGNQDKGRVVQVEYNYFPVDYENLATYPLKSPQVAWAELQAGQGYIAQIDPEVTAVTVRRISLAYYDAFDPQPYYQPVYMFRGDDNFVAYVPAVAPPTTTIHPVQNVPAEPSPAERSRSLLSVPTTSPNGTQR